MNSAQDQLMFITFWTFGAALSAFLAFWRLRNGLKNRRFWHPFYQVAEDRYPIWFKLEKAMTVVLAGMATLFCAVGAFVLLSLLFGKTS